MVLKEAQNSGSNKLKYRFKAKILIMKLGVAADHGGYELKGIIQPFLEKLGHEITDFGAFELNTGDDYPDFVIPLAEAIASKKVDRGIAICGSGVGASIAANKVAGVRAALIQDH